MRRKEKPAKENVQISPADPVSRYRTELMGLAILMIMFCHSTFYVPHIFLANSYGLIKHISQAGVDIFLFLSGMGCYYSFRKPGGIVSFCKRRFLRVLIVYLPVLPVRILIDVLVDGYTVPEALYRYSLISFFRTGELVTWFIAGLLVLYLLFPFFCFLLEKHERIFSAVLVIYVAVLCLVSFCADINGLVIPGFHGREIFYMRVPVFLCGTLYAGKTNKKSLLAESSPFYTPGFLLVLLIFLYTLCAYNKAFNTVSPWFVYRVLFFPISIIVILLLTLLLDCGIPHRLLSHLGKITLELYLLHEWILHIGSKILYSHVEQNLYSSLMINIISAVVAVAAADLLHRLVRRGA